MATSAVAFRPARHEMACGATKVDLPRRSVVTDDSRNLGMTGAGLPSSDAV